MKDVSRTLVSQKTWTKASFLASWCLVVIKFTVWCYRFIWDWVTQPRTQYTEEVVWTVAQIHFLSVFGLRAGTQLHFRGLNFSSSVPKFWFTTTSGMCRVDHSFWNSLERKNEMQTIITFNNHCPSRKPHHTWDGTFEPMFPFRCLRKRSANRMNELASMWKALWIEKENRICVHAPITHQENSFQVIPRDDLLPQKTLSFHIFSILKTYFKKTESRAWTGNAASCRMWMKKKTFWPEGEHCILKELHGCSFCSPSTSLDSSDASGIKHHWWWGRQHVESTC